MPVDFVYRIEQPHRTGMLARVCRAIADGDGLIGDIQTISIGAERSIRDISVEVRDIDQAAPPRRDHRARSTRSGSSTTTTARSTRHEGGKIEVVPRIAIASLQDMRDVYTPGVARVCRAIAADPSWPTRYTMIGRTVAICTNGTRVLGLGNIGPVASMPVMEGKAVFYTSSPGSRAMPILIDATHADAFVETVLGIAPSFGGIHLEDISAPGVLRDREAADRGARRRRSCTTTCTAPRSSRWPRRSSPARTPASSSRGQTVGQLGLGAAGFGIAALMAGRRARSA